MKGKLILIGTSHKDLKCPQRLEKLLRYTDPEILTIEHADMDLESNQKIKKELIEIFEQKGIEPSLAERWFSPRLPAFYEWYTCEKYAKKHNIPLHKIDLPYLLPAQERHQRAVMESYRNLDVTRALIEKSVEFYEAAVREGRYPQTIDSYYNKEFLEKEDWEDCNKEIGERDRYMAERLKDIQKQNPDKRIVHVGGLLHTRVEPKNIEEPTLYMLLPKVDRVHLLLEADHLEI